MASNKNSPRKGHPLELKCPSRTLQGGDKTLGHSSARSSKSTSPAEAYAVEKVMSINRHLVTQIETLRLKIDVDERHHAHCMTTLASSSDSKLKTRELEIENLKTDLGKKNQAIKNYAQQNTGKQTEIVKMQSYIEELKEDVRVSKVYTADIQGHLDTLREEKSKLESGDAYSDKDADIQRLQNEVCQLKSNLTCLEQELAQAKKTIAVQGGQLRQSSLDRGNIQIRFNHELAKVSVSMRNEVEKVRDVMKMQWDEMKQLREQNEGMRSDLREIKELLTSEIHTSSRSNTNSPAVLRPSPMSLPGISRENSRMLHNRKKK